MKKKNWIQLIVIVCVSTLSACGQNTTEQKPTITEVEVKHHQYYSRTDTAKVNVSNTEWEKVLSPDLFAVSRLKDTERAFTGKYWDFDQKGTYYCAACGNQLFRSDQKFSSSCGWPSFFEQKNKSSVVYEEDHSYGMDRIEALCGRCGGHLGHLFDDGPEPTGKRYCMNSIALEFEPDVVGTVENSVEKDTIVLGGGCYWCVEAVYEEVKGVLSVESGFSGGKTKNPSYKEVCTGTTGHAEVVRIIYDPQVLKFEDLLKVFFTVHDPTTLNRQGADVGTQYRSVIFYESELQQKLAKELIEKLNKEKVYENPIVTEVKPLQVFYKAEDYHQNYYENNSEEGYCKMVIQPKLEKFEKVFKDLKK